MHITTSAATSAAKAGRIAVVRKGRSVAAYRASIGKRLGLCSDPNHRFGPMLEDRMRRREAIFLLGSAVAWPFAGHSQQTAGPVIGLLATASPDANAARLSAFREGLRETGYVEGQNVSIEYRWTEESSGRMPELAAQLIDRRVAVLVAAGGSASALAAKAATKSVPIVFGIGGDPVALGLVATLSQPGGNVTGITSLNQEVAP